MGEEVWFVAASVEEAGEDVIGKFLNKMGEYENEHYDKDEFYQKYRYILDFETGLQDYDKFPDDYEFPLNIECIKINNPALLNEAMEYAKEFDIKTCKTMEEAFEIAGIDLEAAMKPDNKDMTE